MVRWNKNKIALGTQASDDELEAPEMSHRLKCGEKSRTFGRTHKVSFGGFNRIRGPICLIFLQHSGSKHVPSQVCYGFDPPCN